MSYPKRLIEVDLPIKRISEHARREKSIRHGHISTLHIWWARRPLAACRAILCASLWPDPADPECPTEFREAAATQIVAFAQQVLAGKVPAESCSEASFSRWNTLAQDDVKLDIGNPAHQSQLRYALLDFIADFSNWDNSTVKAYVDTGRALTQAAHEALGGAPSTRPLVVDPFAGGGAIPLEALRIGADAFASDLNPVAVLLNRLVLQYAPKYGDRLASEVRKWGVWIREQAQTELAEFYPKDPDGSTPVAYLWARTIRCEGPGCGAIVPVITKSTLAMRKSTNIVLRLEPEQRKKHIAVLVEEQSKSDPIQDGTVRRSSVTCPICGYTTPAANVRKQFISRKGGTSDARLLAVVSQTPGGMKSYRVPNQADLQVVERAKQRLLTIGTIDGLPAIPHETLPYLRSIFNIQLLGVTEWGQLFTPRQALHLVTFAKLVRKMYTSANQEDILVASATCMGIAVDKMVDFHTSLTRWIYIGEKIGNTFGRQALGIIWDYAEANPFADISGSWDRCIDYLAEVIEHIGTIGIAGQVEQASATEHPLPDNSASVFITDPPYYDLVPYADLSDFFFVWLKRSVGFLHRPLFDEELSPKQKEIVQLAERNPAYAYKTRENFENLMGLAMAQGRRVLSRNGIGIVFFAHKGTAAWETQLQAMIDAGWVIVGSWPIATEREGRMRAMDSAVLASSIQLVCRPREDSDVTGSQHTGKIGDWRDVLQELPRRIHDWMPRLAAEGVVGADAIFACLGPALEVFSRYERVEKADGSIITLHEYLEQVWSAVGREALNQMFAGADPTGFEEDGRLTALWLWTLSGQVSEQNSDGAEEEASGNDEDDEESRRPAAGGFSLEYDTARKLAQGIGAHLEDLDRPGGVVEIKAGKARLLGVSQRRKALLGSHVGDMTEAQATKKKRGGRGTQMAFEAIKPIVVPIAQVGQSDDEMGDFSVGGTTLDRIHQSMLLFGEGRSEALKRFLVEDGAGQDQRFWRLAQTLSALYPQSSQEKRWVDGVLARKKGLGL